MNPILPIKDKKPLSMQVMEAIKKAIIDEELKPGDTLPAESELVNRLGVSKSSVREAIKMLEAVGVVEIKRGNGTILSKTGQQGFANVILFQLLMQNGNKQELGDFRKMVEISYTELAIKNATQADIDYIGRSVEIFEQKIRNGTATALDDIDFHHRILETTHNNFTISLGDAILAVFEEPIGIALQKNPRHALNDHISIFKAIKAKDSAEAAKCIAESVEVWSESI